MPIEWLIILQEETQNPLLAYNQLREMTVKEVHDVLEVIEMRKMYKTEEYRMKLEEQKRQQH